jgi:ABC-2 type transport system ATP-binding protein
MIEVRELRKRYGDTVAVDGLTFTVESGQVTGFLGPNGAGKSTTMRMILGLDRPTHGSATIDGHVYRELPTPLRTVGALLEARAVHTGRSAVNHLLVLAQTQGLPRSRVDDVIALVGLESAASRRAGTFSLGMMQRLGIAAALLGDPQVLILDEPVNGLDPEGIVWIRNLMKSLAAEGRTVFVSSHLMGEIAITADHLIVIGRGKLIADCPTNEFIEQNSEQSVLVRSPDVARLRQLLAANGARVADGPDGAISAFDLPAARIGEVAAQEGIVLHELSPQRASLEEAFMELTRESLEYGAPVAGVQDLASDRTGDAEVTS